MYFQYNNPTNWLAFIYYLSRDALTTAFGSVF